MVARVFKSASEKEGEALQQEAKTFFRFCSLYSTAARIALISLHSKQATTFEGDGANNDRKR
jgi:hypothetical protein